MIIDNLDIRGVDRCTVYQSQFGVVITDSFTNDQQISDESFGPADSGQNWIAAPAWGLFDGVLGLGGGDTQDGLAAMDVVLGNTFTLSVDIRLRTNQWGGLSNFRFVVNENDTGDRLYIEVLRSGGNIVTFRVGTPGSWDEAEISYPGDFSTLTATFTSSGVSATYSGVTLSHGSIGFTAYSYPEFRSEFGLGMEIDNVSIVGEGPDSDICYQDCTGPGSTVAEDDFQNRDEVSDYWATGHSGDVNILGVSADEQLTWTTTAQVSGYGGLEPVRVTVGIQYGDSPVKQVYVLLPSTPMLPATADITANGAENLMAADFIVSMDFMFGTPVESIASLAFEGGDTGVFWATIDDVDYYYGYYASIFDGPGGKGLAIQGPGVDTRDNNISFPTGSWGVLTWVNRPSIHYGKISYVVDGTEYALEVTFPVAGDIPSVLRISSSYGSDGITDGGVGWEYDFDNFKVENFSCTDVGPGPGIPYGLYGSDRRDFLSVGGQTVFQLPVRFDRYSTTVYVDGLVLRNPADYTEIPDEGKVVLDTALSVGTEVTILYIANGSI